MSSRMPRLRSFATAVLAVAVPAALAVSVAAPAASARTHGPDNKFRQTNLVSDLTTVGAQIVDPNLKNPWGLAFGPTTPLWVADNGTSVATLYGVSPGGATATQVPLVVTLPPMDSSPTGQVFNPTSGFVLKSKAGMGPALFIFSSEGGQIIAWSPVADPPVNGKSTAQVKFSSRSAVFKGLTIASTRFGTFLYATDFHNGRVDVFNSRFHLVHTPGAFRDRHLPGATRRSASGPSTVSSTSPTPSRTRTGTMTWPGPATGSSTCSPPAASCWSDWSPAAPSIPRGGSR